jgi:twinkle protein
MKINGFEIEKENVYGFPQNAKTHTCPLCSHTRKKKTDKCLKIYWDTGLAECFHCGELLQLHTFKKKDEPEKIYSRPKWLNETKLSDNVVRWFENRSISQHALRVAKITEGKEWMPQTKKEENTIQFNFFRDHELINVKYRDGRKNFKLYKDAQKIFYNLDSIKHAKECVIVEGEIDCLSFIEAGIHNCISTPNGSTLKSVNLEYLDDCYAYFENKEKIYLALDNDDPGQNVTKELIRRLGAERCFLVDLGECKDANDLLQKSGKQAIRDLISNAKPCPLENIETLQDHRQQLRDFYLNGYQKGNTVGIETFDNVFSTYTGQFIVTTGIPSHGKSNWVDQMTLGYAINYDWKIAYASPENVPAYQHSDSICQRVYGRKPETQEELDSQNWLKTEEFVSDYFYHIDFERYDLLSTLSKAAELVKRKGVRCVVIDPFNKVRLKGSISKPLTEYTNDYLTEIDIFAKKYDVLVILVAHPTKMEKEATGKRAMPDFYSIKGGSEFYDMSPHGLCVHRDFDWNYVEVKVLKVKDSQRM